MNTYTIIAIVIVAITAVLGDPRSEEFKKAAVECKTKVGATDDDVKSIMMHTKLTTKTAQCMLACIKKKIGVMSEDNKMNIEKAKKMLEPLMEKHKDIYEKMIKILEECKAQETSEADECVAAKKISDCIVSKRDAVGLSSH